MVTTEVGFDFCKQEIIPRNFDTVRIFRREQELPHSAYLWKLGELMTILMKYFVFTWNKQSELFPTIVLIMMMQDNIETFTLFSFLSKYQLLIEVSFV